MNKRLKKYKKKITIYEQETYKVEDIAYIFGLTVSSVERWRKKKWISPSISVATKPFEPNLYSKQDLLRIKRWREIMWQGVDAERALRILNGEERDPFDGKKKLLFQFGNRTFEKAGETGKNKCKKEE
jgi:hypothetical protein